MNKKICIALICILSLGLTACGNKNDWTAEEDMGEIQIDPNDTESLVVNQEEFSEEKVKHYSLDIEELVEKVETEAHTFVIHECSYLSHSNSVVLRTMIHKLTEQYNKKVTLQIFNKSNEIIASSEIQLDEETGSDVNFSIEAKLPQQYNSENISKIKIFAE